MCDVNHAEKTFLVSSVNGIPTHRLEYIDASRSKFFSSTISEFLSLILAVSLINLFLSTLVLEEDRQETIDAIVKINEEIIYEKEQGE